MAKNGWICSGGETGEFTAIDMSEDRGIPDIATDDAALEQALASNPDASQLLETSGDLVTSLRVRQSIRTLAQARKSIVGKSKQFGKERVNCITLWFPPTTLKPFEGAYEEPVAVLANNDKSVAIVSLRSQELLIEIEYPDCVNRAVCSPDGRLLIAVGDDPYLYIHEKTCINAQMKEPLGSEYRGIYTWSRRNRIHLISQSKEDKSDNRGSFAACFSSSGQYLAVGTQYGAISIFDTTTMTNPDVISLVASFTSSRPSNTVGAVRAMEFAPGPVDLLAWTEDRGRVGIADMRNGCISRQIIHLDTEEDYDHITLSDRGALDPRLFRNSSLATNPTPPSTNHNGGWSDFGRREPTLSHDQDLERINQPLSPDETRVLEALQEHSRRRVQRAADRVATTSQRLLSERSRPTDPARTERSAIVSAAVNDVLGSIRDLREQRDRIRENIERQERIRNYARQEEAENEEIRRRHPSSDPRGAAAGGRRVLPAQSALDLPADTTSARRALASRLMGDAPPPSGAWSDLEALWNLSFDTGPYAGMNPYESLRGAVDADARRRDRAAFLIREWETNPARRMGLASMGLSRSAGADPFDTAGLSWSADGRKL